MSEQIKQKRATPLIRRIPNRGGSFFTMLSSAEDLNLSISESGNTKFRFSKFALLNLPDIKSTKVSNTTTTINPEEYNFLRLDSIPSAYDYINLDSYSNRNMYFAESFQNYCLNLENSILSSDSYNSDLALSVSERVFWKWLKEMGGIRFNTDANTSATDIRFIEQNNEPVYNRVVKYIGDIDYVDKYSGNDNSYNSVYVHIPLDTGAFPKVLFKTTEDENYAAGRTFYRSQSIDDLNEELILGRHIGDEHPDGLSLTAFYDNDFGLSTGNVSMDMPILMKKNTNSVKGNTISLDESESGYDLNTWWFDSRNITNEYLLEPDNFNDSSDDILAIFNEETGLDINLDSTRFKRSKLDGIGIDFDANSYVGLSGERYTSLLDVALSPLSQSFEFNTILLYYDLYETQTLYNELTGDLESTEVVKATNLFGVLFLDSYKEVGNNAYEISRYQKCKPNEIFGLNGNSYGFRLNFKINLNNQNVGVETEFHISDSNTLSMEMFHETLAGMFELSQSINRNQLSTLTLDQRIRNVEEIAKFVGPNSVTALSDKIEAMEVFLNENNLRDSLTNYENLVGLIQNNVALVNSILANKTPFKVAFDLGKLTSGSGVTLEPIGDSIKIDTTKNEFSYSDKIFVERNDWTQTQDLGAGTSYLTYTHNLTDKKNYIRFDDGNNTTVFSPDKNLKLYIDDSTINWQTGQVIRLYWKTPYNLNLTNSSKTISIYTDSNNRMKNNKPYQVAIAEINSVDFVNRNNSPVIEIQCIDANNYQFVVDFLN